MSTFGISKFGSSNFGVSTPPGAGFAFAFGVAVAVASAMTRVSLLLEPKVRPQSRQSLRRAARDAMATHATQTQLTMASLPPYMAQIMVHCNRNFALHNY